MKRTSFIYLLAILTGCNVDLDTNKIAPITVNPSIAIPIINSTFGFDDFVNSVDSIALIETDAEGLITLVYDSGPLFSRTLASYLDIPDKTTSQSIVFNNPELTGLPISLQITKTDQHIINLVTTQGDLLDSIFLEAGNMRLELQSNFPTSGQIIFRFLSMSRNGAIVESTYQWSYSGAVPSFNLSEIQDLAGLKLDLTNNGTTQNTFIFETELTVFYEGQSVPAGTSFDLNLELLDFEVLSLYGNIAERTLDPISDTLQLDFFDKIDSGTFYLDQPEINLTIGNSFGIPAEIVLNSMVASSTRQQLGLTGSVNNPQTIGAPTVANVGDTVFSVLSINGTNSNLGNLISILPSEIRFSVGGRLNPNGSTSQNFALKESMINVNMEVRVPLIGRASNLKAVEEINFDGSADLNNLETVMFQVKSINGFPFSVDLQVYFLDQFGQIIDKLIEDENVRLLEGAQVDAQGNVIATSENVFQIEIDADKIRLLQNATTIRIETTFHTSNNGTTIVKVKDNGQVTIKIGMFASVEVTL